MNIEERVVALARKAHKKRWSAGKDVYTQTKKAQVTCREWQASVQREFEGRFDCECSIAVNKGGRAQRIDLVDCENRTAYELKASPNNVHMEIYRDVFKSLVFNERHPGSAIRALVFIAPRSGIAKLGESFVEDVKKLASRLGLDLRICSIT